MRNDCRKYEIKFINKRKKYVFSDETGVHACSDAVPIPTDANDLLDPSPFEPSVRLDGDSKTRICSSHDSPHHGEQHPTSNSDQRLPMPTIDPHDLVGCKFLLLQQEDGQCFLAYITKTLDDYKSELGTQPEYICFLCSAKDGGFEEILSYSELMDSLESQEDGEGNQALGVSAGLAQPQANSLLPR